MSTSLRITAALVIVAAAIGLFLLSNNNLKRSDILPPDQSASTPVSDVPSGDPANVAMADGKQVIAIQAKGGYSPKSTVAKAGVPTVIKMVTKGTFDCSSSLTIQSLGYQGVLPATGETLIDVPAQEKGATLQGVCSMGMYTFAIKFE